MPVFYTMHFYITRDGNRKRSKSMNRLSKIALSALPLLLLVAGSALAKSTPINSCGFEIEEPGNYKLVKDLGPCSEGGIAIYSSDVSLDLKGHSITCSDTDEVLTGGVVALGSSEPLTNVTIRNGKVSNCHDGVALVNVEDSKVTRIIASGNRTLGGPYSYGTGITVYLSNNNVISHNELIGNESHGLGVWVGTGNVIKHNNMTGNLIEGIWMNAGIDSLIMCNDIYENGDGIAMSYYYDWGADEFYYSDGNLLQGNRVVDNDSGGIWMYSELYDPNPATWPPIPADNTVRLNIFENNGMGDLFEIYYVPIDPPMIFPPEGACPNTWQKNRYGSAMAAPGCVPESFDLEDVCGAKDDD
jgi:hypothetical protein